MSLLDERHEREPDDDFDASDRAVPELQPLGGEADDGLPLSPPADDRLVRNVLDVLVVLAAGAFVFWQLHPSLLLADTTPAGGDMGAHVWGFSYFRDTLLPHFRLSGWTPDWYNGFPAFQFYMVIPFVAMVVLNMGFTGPAVLLPVLGAGALAVVGVRRGLQRVGAIGPRIERDADSGSENSEVAPYPSLRALVSSVLQQHRWYIAALAVLVVGVALPFGVSFKLVTVAGVVAMPAGAYAFGRLARFPYPTPVLMAVAVCWFLFDKNFTIYGGNIASTLAGEFAFSISLALSLFYLGVLVHGLRTGTHRATAAVLLALVGLTHLLPAFFALGATIVLWGAHVLSDVVADLRGRGAERIPGAKRLWWLVTTGVAAGLLSAFWVLPFFWNRTYLNDMGWGKIAVRSPGQSIWAWFSSDIVAYLVPTGTVSERPTNLVPFAIVAAIGAVLSIVFRNRIGIALVVTGLALATAFMFVPQGRLWNARLLPFWYLVVYLLAAVGIGEVVRSLAHLLSNLPDRPSQPVNWMAGPVLFLVFAIFMGGQLRNLPFSKTNADQTYSVFGLFDVSGRHFVTDWSRWNYSGYERKAKYPEYAGLIRTMQEVSEDYGCGRSLWEYHSDINDYGTPMAPMLLPHWTDGCIGSQEGLYFEASSTTPFHFLMQSELSQSPSRAQRDMPYRDFDIDAGVEHLQLMGVKYYMSFTTESYEAARRHPDLTEVASSSPWTVFVVGDAAVVTGLAYEPAVTTSSQHQHGDRAWLCAADDPSGRCTGPALDWFQDSSQWDVALAATGPSDWQRVDWGDQPDRRPITPAAVSDIVTDDDGISFTVDRVGSPVLVKSSYFPNWKASGAKGPYRVAPNLMVVVPTSTEVRLDFGRTAIDWLSMLLTLAGIALVALYARSGPVLVPALGHRAGMTGWLGDPTDDDPSTAPPSHLVTTPDGTEPAEWYGAVGHGGDHLPADRDWSGGPEQPDPSAADASLPADASLTADASLPADDEPGRGTDSGLPPGGT